MRFLLFLLCLMAVHAATHAQDSTRRKAHRWTRRTPALRIGLSRTPAYIPEIGVSVHRHSAPNPWLASDCFYGALEQSSVFFTDAGKLVTGFKAGYERSWRAYLWGWKQSDKEAQHGMAIGC